MMRKALFIALFVGGCAAPVMKPSTLNLPAPGTVQALDFTNHGPEDAVLVPAPQGVDRVPANAAVHVDYVDGHYIATLVHQ